MENPVKQARESLGLDRAQFAMAAGVSYGEVWKSEIGYNARLHSRLARFLQESGYVGEPADDYEEWRRQAGSSFRGRQQGE